MTDAESIQRTTIMGTHFTVTSRAICDCGQPITNKRSRKFCSKQCRDKSFQQKYQAYRSEWQRKRTDARASVASPKKVKCLVCGRYYVQVGTHVIQRHGFESAREYREQFELPLKRGIVPEWYRELKAEQAIERGGAENLKIGKRYWYKKGDKRAKENTGYKGRAREVAKLPQEIYPHKI